MYRLFSYCHHCYNYINIIIIIVTITITSTHYYWQDFKSILS